MVRADNGGVLHVPLSYRNFVPTSPAPTVSTATNPVIPGVTLAASGSTVTSTSDWLLDTGSGVTMVGRNIATALGLLNQPVVTTTTVLGIGGDQRTINGYEVASLTVPQINGDPLIFRNIVVFVPGVGDLPADLPGIVGMNLLDNSFSGVDDLGDFTNSTTSVFSDWYVVPGLLPGDANRDGTVNGGDLNAVLSNFNKTVTGDTWAHGDFYGNGTVNGADLNAELSNFNQHLSVAPPCPSRPLCCWRPRVWLGCWPTPGGSESNVVGTLCVRRKSGLGWQFNCHSDILLALYHLEEGKQQLLSRLGRGASNFVKSARV